MQISKISASSFYSNAPKKAATAITNKLENPMTNFVKETKGLHDFYPSTTLVPSREEAKTVSHFYPPREVMQAPNKTKAVDNNIVMDWQQI